MSDEKSENDPIEPKTKRMPQRLIEAYPSLGPNLLGDLDDVRTSL